jgi:hypothetical protein
MRFFGFWWQLPSRTRAQFAIAGGCFVAGAIGLELVGAQFWADGHAQSTRYRLTTAVEETLEMVGIALFASAAYELLLQRLGGIPIQLLGAATPLAGGEPTALAAPPHRLAGPHISK